MDLRNVFETASEDLAARTAAMPPNVVYASMRRRPPAS
jgi:hypothetical protein